MSYTLKDLRHHPEVKITGKKFENVLIIPASDMDFINRSRFYLLSAMWKTIQEILSSFGDIDLDIHLGLYPTSVMRCM